MRWRVPTIVLCLLLLVHPVGASGPDPSRPIKQMRHASWNEASGLSGLVYTLAQTTDGFLWVGTLTGLYRFDGIKFESYLELAGHPISEVRALFPTSDGGLWIGYRDGVAFLKEGNATVYTEQQGLPYGRVRSLAQTRDGAIWAAVVGGLARLSNDRWERILDNWNYPAISAEDLMVDDAGTLWVTGGGVVHFLPNGSRTFQHTAVHVSGSTTLAKGPDDSIWGGDQVNETIFKIRQPLANGNVEVSAKLPYPINMIRFDRAHSLWIATDGGLYRLSHNALSDLAHVDSKKLKADEFLPADGLTDLSAFSILEDKEGNVWVGTGNGLDRFSDRSVTQVNIGYTPSFLITGPHSEVWTDPNNSTFLFPIHESKPYLVPNYLAHSFYMDRTETLWAALQVTDSSESRALWKVQDGRPVVVPSPPELKGPFIKGIVSDSQGRLWMTISGYGEYTLQDGKWEVVPVFSGKDHDLSPDAEFVDALGRAWLVYYARDTVVMIDGGKRTFFTPDHGLDQGSPIIGWASGTQVWIAGTSGLGIFDGQRFKNIRSADGSTFGNVTAIVPTQHDGLWLRAPEGVIQIPTSELDRFLNDQTYAVQYRRFDGTTDFAAQLSRETPSPDGTQAVRSGDGKLWFITNGGVAMIDPAHLAKNELPPPVFIPSLTANGRVYSTYHDLSLPKSTRDVSLDYTALSLTLPERNRFRYQLVGVDKEWKDVGTRRQAFYTNLAPGTYTFKVIAANNDGMWNETGASITFTIPPTFFQTIWFRILAAIVLATIVWLFFLGHLRRSNERIESQLGARLMERDRIARELHDTLLQGFQMLVLRFQVITDTISPESPVKELLEDSLSRAERTLQEGRDKVSALRSEIESGKDLALELAKFGRELSAESRTAFQLTVEGNARAIHHVVYEEIRMIAREAITNSFRHANANTIECVIQFASRHFSFVCRDNGCGIPEKVLETQSRERHWGLVGMRERAREIGATLRISRCEPCGTEVELKLRAGIAYAANTRSRFFSLFGHRGR